MNSYTNVNHLGRWSKLGKYWSTKLENDPLAPILGVTTLDTY